MIEPLAHPELFGGDPEEGVDVVVPSVAGYAWSGKPPNGPQGRRTEAAQIHELMTSVLGYEGYVAGGGDFGAMIAAWMAVDRPDAIRGVHVYAPNVRPAGGGFFETNPPEDYTARGARVPALGDGLSAAAHGLYANIQASSSADARVRDDGQPGRPGGVAAGEIPALDRRVRREAARRDLRDRPAANGGYDLPRHRLVRYLHLGLPGRVPGPADPGARPARRGAGRASSPAQTLWCPSRHDRSSSGPTTSPGGPTCRRPATSRPSSGPGP